MQIPVDTDPNFNRAIRIYIRRVARQARAAARRLRHAEDSDALHDFRVAVRRLRTWFAALHLFAGVPRRTLRQWRRLAHGTNAARDREILLDWLRVQRRSATPPHRAVLTALIRIQSRSHRSAARTVVEQVHRRWPRRARQLTRLTPALTHIGSHVWARQVRLRIRALRSALRAIEKDRDSAEIHRARISAKHVRYLLEPLCAHPKIAAAIVTLTQVQDAFGKSNDLVVIDAMLGELRADTTDPALRRELSRMRRHARQQQRAGFIELRARYLGQQLNTLVTALRRSVAI